MFYNKSPYIQFHRHYDQAQQQMSNCLPFCTFWSHSTGDVFDPAKGL